MQRGVLEKHPSSGESRPRSVLHLTGGLELKYLAAFAPNQGTLWRKAAKSYPSVLFKCLRLFTFVRGWMPFNAIFWALGSLLWVLWQTIAPWIIPRNKTFGRRIFLQEASSEEKTNFLGGWGLHTSTKCFTIEILLTKQTYSISEMFIHKAVCKLPSQLLYCKMLMHNFLH